MSKLSKCLLIVLSLHCVSCQPKKDDKTNIEKLQGLWGVTYSYEKSYREMYIIDSLVVLLHDDFKLRFRTIKVVDDSIKHYRDGKGYLAGKIIYLNDNKLIIKYKDFESDLRRIDNMLLDDNIMREIAVGTTPNQEKMWIERYSARMNQRKETRKRD